MGLTNREHVAYRLVIATASTCSGASYYQSVSSTDWLRLLSIAHGVAAASLLIDLYP
jgi:hypothetical protein